MTDTLDHVVRRIAREHRVRERTARRWMEEALDFLDECAAAGHELEPSKTADKAWHQFILHTRDYEAYCLERFGRFIHHTPYEPRRRRGGCSGANGAYVAGCGGGDAGGGDSGGGGCGGGGCGGGGG
jgi:hypothetical protein